ncbi:MAG: hypothetical protein G01um101470_933 [Parcubacteria group bacterium Gr01-1014_70]|nr:MAG: hypothetical protein G01um101470_933 [Parcubacteria group bacterium Gr01-1014_70]
MWCKQRPTIATAKQGGICTTCEGSLGITGTVFVFENKKSPSSVKIFEGQAARIVPIGPKLQVYLFFGFTVFLKQKNLIE